MARHSELVKIPRIDLSITKQALGTAPLGGLFTSVADSEAESTILADLHTPLTAAAIQFPLRHPAVTSVLTGSRTVKELTSNIADFDREIPLAVWDALEDSGLVNRIEV
jgi:aryl-alcohol dehydrogenase-like predicted oxidoreductase